MAKDRIYRKLIHTSRWVALRRSVLGSHPLCLMCEREGFVTAAVEVHHVIPVEEGLTAADKERLMFNLSNLMPLCHECHVKAHMELGRCGKEAAAARTQRKLEAFRKKIFD